MKKFCQAIFLSILFSAALNQADAVGLSVSPPELKASGTFLKTASAKLVIKNSSEEVAFFEVYPDNFEDSIKISPSSFILESGEKREVEVRADFKKSGQYRTDISVVTKPIATSPFKAAGGLKIPFTVAISEGNLPYLGLLFSSFDSAIAGALLLLGLVVFFALKYGLERFKKIKN